VPEGKRDEVYVFLSDILPTAWHANELGQVGEGDRVAIWGAGPGAPCSDGGPCQC
jgi:threonine dehydrogenase-like Zn-dependent dehydrogenase